MKDYVSYKILNPSFKGRITRFQYFYSTVFIVFGLGFLIDRFDVVNNVALMFGAQGERGSIFVIGTLLVLFISYLFLKASVLRLHDMNYSGSYAILMTFLLGLAYLIVCFYPPQNEKNEYGPEPTDTVMDKILFAIAAMIVAYAFYQWNQIYQVSMGASFNR
ncbi:MAG: DUF805 domain-containing protein [Saezia sp.]